MESKMPDVYSLILAGGSGVRLWPHSREEMPKQFLSLHGSYTLLQETVERMQKIIPAERLYVISGASWKNLLCSQIRQTASVSDDFFIEEPQARNTAPAILLGCEFLKHKGASENDVIVIVPSDHLIKDINAFGKAVSNAITAAESGYIVTLGITPTRPDTGFGYIECKPESNTNGRTWYEVKRFVEKPDQTRAQEFFKSKNYFWNSGIFIFTIDTLYKELKKTSPELFRFTKNGYDHLLKNFADMPSIAFDYAVMEKAANVAMVKLDAGWSDVGSWDALYDILEKDAAGNTITGNVMTDGAKNCLIDSRNRLTVVVDAEDLIIVDSPDAIFISGKGSSQKVRDIVARLKKREQ